MIPITHRLWQDQKCTKHLPFWKLSWLNPNWQGQESINDDWVDMWLALLLHYNLDLAASSPTVSGRWTCRRTWGSQHHSSPSPRFVIDTSIQWLQMALVLWCSC
jgi:hypothetical protein